MPSIEIHVNLLLLPFMVIVSALLGYAVRRSQIKSLKLKVVALENEMLQNHAEILALQKEISKNPAISSASKTPVVSIKDNNVIDEKVVTKKQR